MAIMDSLTEFCDAVSVAASAGTALVGSQIDLSAAGFNPGEPVYLNITVDTAIVTGGSAGTVQFVLASDDTATIATDGTATDHLYTQVFVTDDSPTIPAGSVLFSGAIPTGSYVGGSTGTDTGTYERYLGLLCITATTTTTAGKINAWLSNAPIGKGVSRFADASN
jgi:hypothetical protein